MINEYEPQTITHPGDSLNEKLQEMQMTQKEFALLIAQSEKTINIVTPWSPNL
jgi:plasmid maintenance system antidote protein VapI